MLPYSNNNVIQFSAYKNTTKFFWRGPIKVRYVSNEIYENAAVIVNVEHIERRLLDLRRLPHGAVDDDGPMDKA